MAAEEQRAAEYAAPGSTQGQIREARKEKIRAAAERDALRAIVEATAADWREKAKAFRALADDADKHAADLTKALEFVGR